MTKILTPLHQSRINTAISKRKGAERFELRDGATPGLALCGGPLGCSWVMRATVGPQKIRKRFNLGDYPTVTLSDARRKAAEKYEELKSYIPSSANSNVLSVAPTLSSVISEYEKCDGGTLKRWDEQKRRLEHVLVSLLQIPLASLSEPQIQLVIDAHPSKSSAAACVRYLRPMLRWAAKRGMCAFKGGEIEQPRGVKRKRNRMLSDAELQSLFAQLKYERYDLAVRLMLLTVARREEVCAASLDEFDLKRAVWTIPAERCKNGRALVVPLVPDVVALLEPFRGETGALFQPALSNWDRWQKRMFALTHTNGWQRHDLRRTSATLLGGMGVAPHIVEIVLGHAEPHSQLAGIYNQSRYEREHRDALMQLAAYYRKIST